MTQIKLRRDTSAAFASSNPILGIGEPAYETDTKKLKIGDGTTAYTQLEYFSAGGGGSTNISATLPLKIIDGVISLEVDGQTIQIVDGKLHANLDELGNKVNSLTGEVTDLSGRVTAAEANLDKKENKITTTGALSLQEKIISNLTNMTETETQITPNINQYFTVNSNEFYFSGTTYNSPQCYIAIPYQFGQWLKIPGGYNTLPSVFFGHFLEDGDFLITAVFRGDCYEHNHPIFGGIVRGRAPVSFSTYSGSFYLNSYSSVSEKAMESNIKFTETDPCAYLQLIDNTSSGNIICGSYNYGYGPNSSGVKGYAETHVVYNRDLTNYTVQDFVRDTTTALIMSPSTSYPILKSAVGLYAATNRLGWNQDGYNQLKANLGENLFDLTKSQVNNYLELNLGDGLSVVDGKLTASSTAPTNMVTTDTAQTITGHKSFSGELTIDKIDGNYGLYISTHPLKGAIRFGNTERDVIIAGKGITTEAGDKFLTSGNVTAGDNIAITNTTNGVQIASTVVTPVRYPVEVSDKSLMPSWYVVYNDGWCEQGGRYNSGDGALTVELLKAFVNINYTVSASLIGSDGAYLGRGDATLSTLTPSSFKIDFKTISQDGVGTAIGYFWQASGYIR